MELLQELRASGFTDEGVDGQCSASVLVTEILTGLDEVMRKLLLFSFFKLLN